MFTILLDNPFLLCSLARRPIDWLLRSAGSVVIVFIAIAITAWSTSLLAEEKPTADQIEFFEKHVRPVLATRCYQCHGDKKQEGGLRLDSRAHILRGGDSDQPAIKPGKPAESLLIEAVQRTGDYEMPPEKGLPANEIKSLQTWVAMGAPWPGDTGAPVISKAELLAQRNKEIRESMWSLQPIVDPPLAAANDEWSVGKIDRLIAAKQRELALSPSLPADRATLIRRAYFDLLGVPPSPDEVARFVDDQSPDAWERLIDRLLASPLVGQRWGRHWLDVARYADTKGYAFQKERRYPYSYTYRDYVIDAFNHDKPIDQFFKEQIAADLLDLPADSRDLAAMGFLTVGRRFNNVHLDIDDRIDVVTRGMLGLTVTCARCHDHKYDAIPTADYYSLYGVFASTEEPGELPLIGEPADKAAFGEYKKQFAKLESELQSYLKGVQAEIVARSRENVADYLIAVATKLPEAELRKQSLLKLKSEDYESRMFAEWRKYLNKHAHPNDATLGLWRALIAIPKADFPSKSAEVITRFQKRKPGIADGELNPLVAEAFNGKPPADIIEVARRYATLFHSSWQAWKTAGANQAANDQLSPPQRALAHHIIADGSPTNVSLAELSSYYNRAQRNKARDLEKKIDTLRVNSPGAPPRAMVLQDRSNLHNPRIFIRGDSRRSGDAVPRRYLWLLEPDRQPWADSGRLAFAEKITSTGNPLTLRVFANRVWMHHFGSPLVATPSDFGIQSSPPSNPELLDYLASRLLQSEWSLKDLHREIMLSATYRQQSIDRPDARAIDPLNRSYWKMNRRRLEWEPLRDSMLAVANQLDLSLYGKPVDVVQKIESKRRSVYGFIDRQDLPGLFRVFNLPNPDQHAATRPNTVVPQQALFMLNSPFVQQQAAALMRRPDITAASEPAERIDRLYRLLFSRPPREDEAAVGLAYVTTAKDPEIAWRQYAQLLLMTNEFAFVD